MTASPATASTSLFKGGPSLIDLMLDVGELRLTVTGPRMLFEKLVLVTTLSALDGCTVARLREVAGLLEGTVHCGLIGVQRAEITVVTHRSGGRLEIGLGPASMYQSELVLRTRTGESFRELMRRLSDDPPRAFLAALHAETATGHLEHDHDPPSEHGPDSAHHRGGEEHGGHP